MILISFIYIITTIFIVVQLWSIDKYFWMIVMEGVFWTVCHLGLVFSIVSAGSSARSEVVFGIFKGINSAETQCIQPKNDLLL